MGFGWTFFFFTHHYNVHGCSAMAVLPKSSGCSDDANSRHHSCFLLADSPPPTIVIKIPCLETKEQRSTTATEEHAEVRINSNGKMSRLTKSEVVIVVTWLSFFVCVFCVSSHFTESHCWQFLDHICAMNRELSWTQRSGASWSLAKGSRFAVVRQRGRNRQGAGHERRNGASSTTG